MNSNPVETMSAAELVPWAQPNEAAVAVDELVSEAVRRAFAEPIEPEYVDAPLLRFATPGVPTMPLMEAVVQDPLPRHDSHTCDRCGDTKRSVTDRLWIPQGQSVVVVAMCWKCRACAFEHAVAPSSLVWS